MAASKVSFRVPMWLGIAVVSALAVISVLLASNAPSARPASQRLIAFTRGDGVYVMHADGSGEHRILTHRGALYGGVAWSPDRSRLALATSEGIWVMGAAGQQLVRLATPGPVGMLDGKPYSKRPSLFDSPTWSPDGRKIAFTAYQGHDRDIWVTNADGTNQHRLKKTPFPPFFEGGVDWSPAGDRLVFDSGSWVSDVYVMRTNGSSLRNLTPGGGWVGSGQPSWKPTGTRSSSHGQTGSGS